MGQLEVCVYMCVSVCWYVCVCLSVSVSMCMCMCMCLSSLSLSQQMGEEEACSHLAAPFFCGQSYRTHQPLGLIKSYFGEKIAFYFAWLEFYTRWLVAPAIAGIVIFVLGFAFQADRADVTEFCNSNKTICGVCSTCDTWTLGEACQAYEIG